LKLHLFWDKIQTLELHLFRDGGSTQYMNLKVHST
jgi:hypothetical protein